MSGRRIQLVLTENASRDLQQIQDFTLESWGQEQATGYDDAILKALETIREHPNLGIARSELGSGFRSLRVKSHNILYRVTGDTVVVHRILHQRRDVTPDHLA